MGFSFTVTLTLTTSDTPSLSLPLHGVCSVLPFYLPTLPAHLHTSPLAATTTTPFPRASPAHRILPLLPLCPILPPTTTPTLLPGGLDGAVQTVVERRQDWASNACGFLPAATTHRPCTHCYPAVPPHTHYLPFHHHTPTFPLPATWEDPHWMDTVWVIAFACRRREDSCGLTQEDMDYSYVWEGTHLCFSN